MELDTVRRELSECGQGHLLAFWEELSPGERERLLRQLRTLDPKRLKETFEAAMHAPADCGALEMDPIPRDKSGMEEGTEPELLEEYRRIGLEEISEGRVAVLLLAGGQGTRLGVTYPKGMFPIEIPSKKTLFQLQAERIRRLARLAEYRTGKKGRILWYIMTSEATHDATLKFLSENRYFGLDADDVVLFQQGMLPCFDFQGKILLERRDSIALSPDGNGGLYLALKENRILDDMRRRGVKYVHAHSVDNILVKVADPVFVGYCVENRAECGAKVVKKSSPTEPVGVVCKVNGRFRVVEYSEIPERTARLEDEDGELVFRAGNICNHFFAVEFLEKVCFHHEAELKLHVAKKKIAHVTPDGVRVEPSIPNGVKMEKFIFDVFEFAERFVTWEVRRDTDFSPLKNCDSADSDCPYTVRRDLLELHRRYVEENGGKVLPGVQVEVSPLLSYAGEDLRERVDGETYENDTVLEADEEKLDVFLPLSPLSRLFHYCYSKVLLILFRKR